MASGLEDDAVLSWIRQSDRRGEAAARGAPSGLTLFRGRQNLPTVSCSPKGHELIACQDITGLLGDLLNMGRSGSGTSAQFHAQPLYCLHPLYVINVSYNFLSPSEIFPAVASSQ